LYPFLLPLFFCQNRPNQTFALLSPPSWHGVLPDVFDGKAGKVVAMDGVDGEEVGSFQMDK
jgi:hypothetical protein